VVGPTVPGMTEPAHLAATRASHDTVAEDFAELCRDALAGVPQERALLDAFGVDAYRLPPDRVIRQLTDAGIRVTARVLSQAGGRPPGVPAGRAAQHLMLRTGRRARRMPAVDRHSVHRR
jgi:hypothetical protein